MFVTNIDLSTVLDAAQLAQVISISNSNRKRAEDFALEEATSYLNFRYDTVLIFGYKAFDYSASAVYNVGEIVISSEGEGYTCIQTTTAGIVLTNEDYFTLQDDRNPIIVMIVLDLLAYHLFSKLPQNRVPQKIIDRYDQAIAKLKDIRSQKMNPLLPIKVVEEGQEDPNRKTETITITSNPKRNNYYD
jgi:hypothetical protein